MCTSWMGTKRAYAGSPPPATGRKAGQRVPVSSRCVRRRADPGLLLLITPVMWGATFPGGKIALRHLPVESADRGRLRVSDGGAGPNHRHERGVHHGTLRGVHSPHRLGPVPPAGAGRSLAGVDHLAWRSGSPLDPATGGPPAPYRRHARAGGSPRLGGPPDPRPPFL